MSFVMTYTTLVSSFKNYVERDDDDLDAEIPTFVLFAQKRICRELKILGLEQYATSVFTASNGVIVKPSRWLRTISVNWGSTNGQATSATVTAGGTGYKEPLTISSSGGGASTQATWQGYVTNGVVTQIVPLTPGVGYTSAPTLTITGFGSSGSGATATATVSTSNIYRNILWPRSYEYCRTYWPNENTTGNPKFYADYGYSNWLVVPTPSAAFPIQIAYWELADPVDAENESNWLTENAPDLLLYATLLESVEFLGITKEKADGWQAKYDRAAKAYQFESDSRSTDRATKRSD